MDTAYTSDVTFIDDADFLRSIGWPELQGATPNRGLMRRIACFTCEAMRTPAVTATLRDRHTIALCQTCLLKPARVTTFVGVFLADRRATPAKGYATYTPLPPDDDTALCERVQR